MALANRGTFRWACAKGHIWYTTPWMVCSRGGGCAVCGGSEAEAAVSAELHASGAGYEHHWRPGFIQKQGPRAQYEFDFRIDRLSPLDMFRKSVVLEIDGLQHFVDFNHARGLDEERRGDVRKMTLALQEGHSLVRHLARTIRLGETDWRRLRSALRQAGNTSDPVILLQNDPMYHEMAKDPLLAHLSHLIQFY